MDKTMRKILITGMLVPALLGWHFASSVPEALAVEPICPGGSTPDLLNVIFCEDWEDGNFHQWPECGDPCDTPRITTDEKFLGTQSLELVFDPNRAAGDNRSGGFIITRLNPSPDATEVYFRWYQKWSTNFPLIRQDGSYTRMFRVHTADDVFLSMRAHHSLSNADPEFLIFDPPAGRTYGNGQPKILANRWYLFEVYIKYNTAGSSNGAVKLWVDEALAIERNNIPTTGPAGEMALWLAGYLSGSGDPYGGSKTPVFTWVDQLVVSRAPIGPINVGGGKNAPQAPTGLTVVD